MSPTTSPGVSCSLKVIKKSPKLQFRKGIADQIYRGCDLMCIAQIDIIFVATSLSYITMATRRNSHTNKFKLQAMKLDDDLGNVKKASTELGIPVSNLRYWLSQQSAIVAAPIESHIAVYSETLNITIPRVPYPMPEVGPLPSRNV